MKTIINTIVLAAATLTLSAQSDPRITTWFTEDSGQYARMYRTYEDEQTGTSFTTWANTTYSQDLPAYAGVQSVKYSADYVYIRTTGLPLGHIMGPWYNDTGPGGSEEVFQNWPEAIFTEARFPRTPSIPTQRTAYPAGMIGLMVDGTIIFSSSDTFSYDNNQNGTGTGQDTGPGVQGGGLGDGIWNHDAYITESNTFDKSNSHGAGNQLHYHAVPMLLRYRLGDSVKREQQSSGAYLYTEDFNGKHSPILGWINDGLPLYGPYGFSDPNDTNSAVRRMETGFVVRNGQNGTYDLTANGRNRLPDWANRFQGIGPELGIDQQGPTHAEIAVPYFMEDYAYKGDLAAFTLYDGTGAFVEGTHFDLNEFNVRYCKTPEFPEGTWAYFTCIDANGDPTFPYNVAAQYFGDPSQGGQVQNITENVVTNWVGGPDAVIHLDHPTANNGTITLAWNGVEGGTYKVVASDTLDSAVWSDVQTGLTTPEGGAALSAADTPGEDTRFYRVERTALAAYDSTGATMNAGGGMGGGTGGTTGGNGILSVTPGSATHGQQTTITINLDPAANPQLPPANAPLPTVTVGGITATGVSRNNTAITATLSVPAGAATGAQDIVVTFDPPPGQQQGPSYSLAGGFTFN